MIEIYEKFKIIILPIFLIPIITPDYKLNEKITDIKKYSNIDKIDLEYFLKNGTYEKKEKYYISFNLTY